MEDSYKEEMIKVPERSLKRFISIALIAIRDIQSTSESPNFFQRKKGLFNFEIPVQCNIFGKTIKVKNLEETLKAGLLKLV